MSMVPLKAIEKRPDDEDLEAQAKLWICDLDYRSMMRDSNSQKPFVYIAFGALSPVQAMAVKIWASSTFTKDLLIVVEQGYSHKGWNDFCDLCKDKDKPGVAFFSEEPVYCKLPDIGSILGKLDNISYFSLSWAHDSSSGRPPHYAQTRIFPRGTVILLSEATFRQPAITLDILTWFEKQARTKSKHWKLMVRPNIRLWLQHRALHAENNETGKCYINVLVQMHKLSSIMDVTALGSGLDKLRLLEGTVFSKTPEDYIIPMPALRNHDPSESADDSAVAIRQRDEILLRHFVGWSAMNVSSHRRFLAIDDEAARDERDSTIHESAHHIVFRSAEQFRKEIAEKKKSGAAKKQVSGPYGNVGALESNSAT